MAKFTLTNKAKLDLKSIAAYTHRKWGKEQRYIYAKQFDDLFKLLARSPKTGTDCSYLKPNYRKHPCGNHLVFYRELNRSHIEIVRILHKRMDVKSKLSDS